METRFGSDALYVEYTDPGFILFKKVQERIVEYREQFGKAPAIIFLQNHGVFVGANGVEEIRSIYDSINKRIGSGIENGPPNCDLEEYESNTSQVISDHYGSRGLVSKSVRCELVDHFSGSKD
ncbi:unnamed protein product, partial [marine sediment metagenome]